MDADAGIAADAVEFRFDAGDRLGEVAARHADEAFVILLAELPIADVRRITGDDFFDRLPPKLGPDRKNLADAGPIAGKLVAEFAGGIVQQADGRDLALCQLVKKRGDLRGDAGVSLGDGTPERVLQPVDARLGGNFRQLLEGRHVLRPFDGPAEFPLIGACRRASPSRRTKCVW